MPPLVLNMEYREIVAVTGLGGLYQLLTTKSDGAIVRNLADKSTKFISARLHNVTPLESIEIYTTGDNVRLHEVFQKMKDTDGTVTKADPKASDNNAIKDYFKSIFAEIDEDRVYVSDMKKMLKWYDLLKANDLLNFEAQAEDTAVETTPEAEPVAEVKAETAEEPAEKPAKKAAPKKKKAASEKTDDGAEKPAKKTAAKKKKTEE